MGDDSPWPVDRREILTGVASGAVASMAGCSLFEDGEDGETSSVEGDRAKALAERFAPTLYFDEHERWFPTDPRLFERERDGTTVVDGFDALDGYVARAVPTTRRPRPASTTSSSTTRRR